MARMWRRNPLLEKKTAMVPGNRTRGSPPKAPGKAPGVTPAGQTSELLRPQSENELLKGKVKPLEDHVLDRYAEVVAVRRKRQRADELLQERDSQLLSERAMASKSESGW